VPVSPSSLAPTAIDGATVLPPGSEPGSTRITRGDGFAVQGLGALVGATWGDFVLGELLGRGGMGAVYRARQVSLDRAVAIKVLPPEVAERSDLRERFLREARAIAQVASPHIVQVFHAGTHQGWHFYAMELVEGPDLGRRLRDGWKPDVATARQLVLQAARGLATAGRWNIVHRDIKPGNMLITAEGTLKLTDFGLVRRAGEEQLTVSGQVMGTAGYLSPEQALGKPCDARTDLYALGVVFYELLAGRLPFVSESSTGVIYQHVHEAAIPVQQHNPLVDDASAAICARLMAKAPEERYQTASALIEDLEAVEAGRAPRHTTVFRRKRSRRPQMLALAALCLVGGAAAWFFNQSTTAAKQREHEQAVIQAAQAAQQAAVQAKLAAERAAAAQAAAAEAKRNDAWGRFADLAVPGAAFKLREIQPGSGSIGSPQSDPERARDETPVTVTFTATWWMADSEVTQAQWRAVMGSLPEQSFVGDDLPVSGISRPQADSFCSRLEAMVPDLHARLPSEAEWEYAAHAGVAGSYAGGKPIATQAWFAANAGRQLHPVRQFPPNPWGIYDLHGNVAEWTADLYATRAATALTDPKPVTTGDRGLVKGGAWDDDPEDCRIAVRETARSGSKRIGMRFVALQLPKNLR
jgi:eukaryotic-like serine/threonine-protein kinase